MTRYQLAKIVGWAGTLDTRKRMQKVVYLLRQAGCPLNVDYGLHYYGPYSHEVTRLTGEMVQSGLLEETQAPAPNGTQYSYRLPETTWRQLTAYENEPRSERERRLMSSFEDLAKALIAADSKELEIAATLVYFHGQEGDWSRAAEKTRQFKELPAGSDLLERARALVDRMADKQPVVS